LILTLFGPPGSGKGTQAAFLREGLGLAHLSTGDLLRAERAADTLLGRRMNRIMDRGELVPDEVVRDLVRTEAGKMLARGEGILLDGYPRNLKQLRDLETILKQLNASFDFGVHLEIDDEKLIQRLTARRVCETCQPPRTYNLDTHPPVAPEVCDVCGSKLIQRGDDREEAIVRRLAEYHRQTEPMLEDLRNRGKLKTILADRPIKEVRDQLSCLIKCWEDGMTSGVPVA